MELKESVKTGFRFGPASRSSCCPWEFSWAPTCWALARRSGRGRTFPKPSRRWPPPSGFRFRPHRHHRIGIRGVVDHAQVLLRDELLVQGVVQNVEGTTGGERDGTLDLL